MHEKLNHWRDELTTYLHTHIPISQAMGITVFELSEEQITLTAPLKANINHRATVFGGSAAAIATLAAWSMLFVRLDLCNIKNRTVIQHNQMDYLHPIAGDFTAVCRLESDHSWQRFLATLQRRGRARLSVRAELRYESEAAGLFAGDFVSYQLEI